MFRRLLRRQRSPIVVTRATRTLWYLRTPASETPVQLRRDGLHIGTAVLPLTELDDARSIVRTIYDG